MSTITNRRESYKGAARHAIVEEFIIAPDPADVMVDQHLQALDMDAAWAAKQEDAA